MLLICVVLVYFVEVQGCAYTLCISIRSCVLYVLMNNYIYAAVHTMNAKLIMYVKYFLMRGNLFLSQDSAYR